MKAMPERTDGKLQADVLSELRADTRVGAADVGVAVKEGVVTLSGTVDSWARRHAAQRAAHRVAGVLDVANGITVRLPGSRERTDAEIARAARQALDWDVRVPADAVRTTVTDGEVTLEGTVDYLSQREDAEKAVRYLVGVTGVTNRIVVHAHVIAPADVRLAIAEALRRHAMRETRHIDLSIEDGVVTLTGLVSSPSERRAVLGAACATHGVRQVVDRLTLEAPCL